MMHLCQTLVSSAAASPLPSEPGVFVHAKETEVAAVAGDVEQSDCCLDTSKLWQRSLLLPATTSEGWWRHPVDIRVSEEKHLALPVAGQTLQKHWRFHWCPLQPGLPRQVQHALKVPVKRSRQRWAVETGVTSPVRRCSHAPQRLGRRQKIACRNVHWTAASVAGWRHPGLLYQHRQPPVC